jgi:hypothetical protein
MRATVSTPLITRLVAQRVVDLLEPVQVQEHHAHQLSPVAMGRGDGLGKPVPEQGAVG